MISYKQEVKVMTKDKGEYIVTELVNIGMEELVNGRVFDTHQDMQYTLMALKRGTKYALDHGLACPSDFKRAVKKIQGLPKY